MKVMEAPPNKRMHQTVGAPRTGRYAPPAGDAQRWGLEEL